MLPQYRFESLLGRGGMGAVYKAVQVSLDRAVAVKVLPGDLIGDEDANFAGRFKNEARTMAKMSHPGIVNVYDSGETGTGLLYFVMEFIDGTDVARMIRAHGRLPEDYALSITAHVCDALAYAHARAVIHRDIKPANILINLEGQVKVADFGLAKQSDSPEGGFTKTNMAMGTPDFVAPEVLLADETVDSRVDVYALGVMLYNMLTGEIPRGRFKLPSEKLGGDPRFDGIIEKAMEADREERYQSVTEIRSALDAILTTPLAKEDGVASAPVIPEKGKEKEKPASPPRAGKAGDPGWRPAAAPRPAPKKFPLLPVLLGGVAVLGVAAFFFLSGDWEGESTALPVRLGQAEGATTKKPETNKQAETAKKAETDKEKKPETNKKPDALAPAPSSPPATNSEVPAPAMAAFPLGGGEKENPAVGADPAPSAVAPPVVLPDSPGFSAAVGDPVAAPEESVFVNSLGMKFVAVPGTSVLLCVHETRRQDYAAYDRAEPRVDPTWKTPRVFGQNLPTEDDHPVSLVSWEDAAAFCQWLGRQEGRVYRLPTEREWNLAVAQGVDRPDVIGDEDLARLISSQSPWGSVSPEQAGNYQGDEDGHALTAPVGSFQPNALGLYDMGGNVWEWCVAVGDTPVMRGCGYLNYGPYRKSGTRETAPVNFRVPPDNDSTLRIVGFRVALDLSVAPVPLDPVSEHLAGLDKTFLAAYKEQVGDAHRAAVADLTAKFSDALDRAVAKASQGGHLEEALTLRNEKARVESGGSVPETDEEAAPESLRALRKTWREQMGLLIEQREQAAAPLHAAYDRALAAYQEELTRAGQLDEAARVKDLREHLSSRRESSAPPMPDEAAVPSGGGSPVPVAAVAPSLRTKRMGAETPGDVDFDCSGERIRLF